MGFFTFKLPDIGEGIAESEIALWRVAVGDVITEDQPLVDMLTDKAAVEIPSPVAGKIVRLHGAAGDKIAVGGELVTLEVGAVIVDPPAAAPDALAVVGESPTLKDKVVAGSAVSPAGPAGAVRERSVSVAAAPTVRKRARELDINLNRVRGTGPSGRVLHDDLDTHLVRGRALSPPDLQLPETDRTTVAARDITIPRLDGATAWSGSGDDATEAIRVIGLRRKIAEAVQRSSQRIPHFAYVEEVDVTELEALRVHLNATLPDRPKLTLLPLLIQALVRAVRSFPMVNATFDDDAGVVTRHRALHVGVATQTPNGLVVPVLRHAQRQDLWQRATNIRRLADAARVGKGTREELSGSTITITSLGLLGGVVTTPVINAPEVAIIGVNKMVERPVVRNGQVTIRTMMNLSSSFDHRIVDGFDAASFIQNVRSLLERPATLFLEVA